MRIRNFIFSFRATAILLAIAAAAIAAATIIESAMGTAQASRIVYHSLWFELLGAAIAINTIGCLVAHHRFAAKHIPMLLVHLSIVAIIAGALITRHTSTSGYVVLGKGETANAMMDDSYQIRRLPFSLTLNRFSIDYYPHTHTPSGYTSEITINDKHGKSNYTISMNRIAKYRGWRLFQSSHDDAGTGSVLMAVDDKWGSAITYIGYWMFAIGFLLSLCGKNSPLRRSIAGAAAVLLLSTPCAAQSNKDIFPTSVPKTSINNFDRLIVQGADGRIKTANSVCSEIVRKLHGGETYKGHSASQTVLSMLCEPARWSSEPIIKVKDKTIRAIIGNSTGFISVDEAYSDSVRGKLEKYVYGITSNGNEPNSKEEKAIADLYDRASLLEKILKGDYFAIVPPKSINERWVTAAETLRNSTSDQQRTRIANAFTTYLHNIANRQWNAANKNIGSVKRMQKEAAQSIYPTKREIETEILCNRLQLYKYLKFLYLIIGFAFLAIAICCLLSCKKMPRYLSIPFIAISAIMFAAHTAGIALRWSVSGFVPLSNGYETMIFIAWACILFGLIFAKRQFLLLALAEIVGFAFLMVAGLSSNTPDIGELAPVLKSPWLSIHVASITSSYALFAIVFLLAFVNMCLMMKRIGLHTTDIIRRFTQIMRSLSALGLFFLCIGTIFGAVWANVSWGNYWGWDPKESWALISIIAYAMLMHLPQRYILWYNIGSFWAFCIILMTFFGVNMLFAGMHSYAGSEQVSIAAWVYAVTAALVAFSVAAAIKARKNASEVQE